jgi:hypothetical protein
MRTLKTLGEDTSGVCPLCGGETPEECGANGCAYGMSPQELADSWKERRWNQILDMYGEGFLREPHLELFAARILMDAADYLSARESLNACPFAYESGRWAWSILCGAIDEINSVQSW